MPVDPTDPETFPNEAADSGVPEIDIEAPEADAAEQHFDMEPREEALPSPGLETDPADAAEQALIVDLSEDDYR
jgi:hypothetical protein